VKYIILESDMGFEHPMVFDDAVTHKDAVPRDFTGKVVGAGFVVKGKDGIWKTKDRSDSLNVGPRPEDSTILSLFLSEGMSGLDLQNYLMFLAFQAKK
jgi:hypothetical protein